MAAAGNVVRYTYMGGQQEDISPDATHVTVDHSVTIVYSYAFFCHPNIVELVCHDGVERIESSAFWRCPSLRRVIIPGVQVVEDAAFSTCRALTDVECDKLVIVKPDAFHNCSSLRSINLPSVEIVRVRAFTCCEDLTNVTFGNKLERIEGQAFANCTSLDRISIPLKEGIITLNDIFKGCRSLNQVDLVEGPMHETAAALQLDCWRDIMNEKVNKINRTLPFKGAGECISYPAGISYDDDGEKAITIRSWIRSVLRKIIRCQEEHRRLLDEAGSILQYALPGDIAMKNVLSFLELPTYTFEVEDHSVYSEDDSDDDDM